MVKKGGKGGKNGKKDGSQNSDEIPEYLRESPRWKWI